MKLSSKATHGQRALAVVLGSFIIASCSYVVGLAPATQLATRIQGGPADTVPPPAPVFAETPTDPNPSFDTTFAWTDAESGVSFECQVENAAFAACTSPNDFTVKGNGTHQFSVRAVDAAGNRSGATSTSWKVSKVPFGVTGTAVDTLYPGTWVPIDVVVTNPFNQPIYVTSLTATVTSSPAGCDAPANIEFQQAPLTAAHTARVPANGSAHVADADRPQIRIKDLANTNQNACKGAQFALGFTGLAVK